jgi:hypothetical protein
MRQINHLACNILWIHSVVTFVLILKQTARNALIEMH